MGNLTIDDIKKLAELNLTSECYEKYLAIIHPNIKSIITNYLKDWQSIELYVTLCVMQHKGVFKTSLSFYSIDDDTEEKYGDKIDVKKYREIESWRLKKKIDYLKNEGVLGDNSFKLLHALRKKRNKIHEPDMVFSEKDLQEFSIGKSVIFYIHTVLVSNNMSKEEQNRIKNLAEKGAEEALKVVNSN